MLLVTALWVLLTTAVLLCCYINYFAVMSAVMSIRFAHLISVDFFSDLMSILHSLAETGVSVHTTLNTYTYSSPSTYTYSPLCASAFSIFTGAVKQGVYAVCAHCI